MADFDYVLEQGLIIPDTADVLAEVQGEYRAVFGTDLVVTADTPQGALMVADASSRISMLNMLAAVMNQINPNEAGGIFADALCALTMVERAAATYSMVYGVTVSGAPGAPLPIGSQATMSATGDVFATTSAVTFNNTTGLATVDFRALVVGPVACPVGGLDTVGYVLGWETVTNPTSAAIGTNQQSDASLMSLRKATLARQGMSTPEAQISALSAIDGVFSVSYRENFTGATATIDGISLVANSVWACVNGGADIDVATALLANKTDGANWNGAHTLSVVEPISGQSYLVKWDRPTLIPIQVRVTIRKNSDPTDPTIAIPNAVVNYAAGLVPNLSGFLNGYAVSPFEIAKAVGYYNPLFIVDKVEVSLVSTLSWQTTEIVMALNQAATVIASGVSVIAS